MWVPLVGQVEGLLNLVGISTEDGAISVQVVDMNIVALFVVNLVMGSLLAEGQTTKGVSSMVGGSPLMAKTLLP